MSVLNTVRQALSSLSLRTIFSCAALILGASARTEAAPAAEEIVRFGSTTNLGQLPLIARSRGFFAAEGITVEYKKLQTGKMTMDALISGDIDLGTLVDSNIAYIGFSENPVRVITGIATKLDDAVWFRSTQSSSSPAITVPADLRGKRIGYAPATTSHIFLARFLEAEGIPWESIHPVVLQPAAMPAAIRNGAVDAVSAWQPWGINISNELSASQVGSFPNRPELYRSRVVLATTEQFLRAHPDRIAATVRALGRAKVFLDSKPAEAATILAPEIGVAEKDMPLIAQLFDHSIIMDDALIAEVTRIAEWIKRTQEDFKELPLRDYRTMFAAVPANETAPQGAR